MPKKDPITGCLVMTLPEFLAKEGEREGKSGADVMNEIVAMVEEDRIAIEKQMYDEGEATSLLKYIVDEETAEDLGWGIWQVLRVLETEARLQVFGGESEVGVEALVYCTDGAVRQVRGKRIDWAGSFAEPPSCDVDFEVLPDSAARSRLE